MDRRQSIDPIFFGIRGRASNIVDEGNQRYTSDMFFADFPAFAGKIGTTMLDQYIDMANDAVQEGRWFKKWRYACGLYVAHYATLYIRSVPQSASSPEAAIAGGSVIGIVSSTSLGDASVSYDTSAITEGTRQWGSWNSTSYGQMLITEAKLLGLGGAFVI